MKIKDVLDQKGAGVVTIWNTRQLRDVVQIFDARNIASVIVTDPHGTALGLITDRAVIHSLARHGEAALNGSVIDSMHAPLPRCRSEDPVSKVMRYMTDNRVRHVVVMDDEHMLGLVSIGDLVKIKLDDADLESRVLRERALVQMAIE